MNSILFPLKYLISVNRKKDIRKTIPNFTETTLSQSQICIDMRLNLSLHGTSIRHGTVEYVMDPRNEGGNSGIIGWSKTISIYVLRAIGSDPIQLPVRLARVATDKWTTGISLKYTRKNRFEYFNKNFVDTCLLWHSKF